MRTTGLLHGVSSVSRVDLACRVNRRVSRPSPARAAFAVTAPVERQATEEPENT